MPRKKLAEGKTKIIWSTDKPGVVDIESKDDITAGDGARRDLIAGKAELATRTTANCFALLAKRGIPTHFINQLDDVTFRAHHLVMLPIECVARRLATGSYLKRNPIVAEGTVFKELVMEMFLKDDQRHDPMMIWNKNNDNFDLFDAKQMLAVGPFGIAKYEQICAGQSRLWWFNAIHLLRQRTMEIFQHLETAWDEQGVSLVDLKVEYGIAQDSGQFGSPSGIILGDVIDNDSWRIWPGGDKTQMKDKQVYRDSQNRTPQELGKIKENYHWVADKTNEFSL